ncbi:NAC domain-containing protein 10 [Linum perenne]
MSKPTLPPGFRFHPTDQELLIYYLKPKLSSSSSSAVVTSDINIYKFDPWDLPSMALFGENEWFFFSPRDRKYPNGARPNRTAATGYWKATGTDKPILSTNGSHCLGVKKALVFYQGRPPKGRKTNWMMLEYRLLDDPNQLRIVKRSMREMLLHMQLDDFVLCRVRLKSNGLQNPMIREESFMHGGEITGSINVPPRKTTTFKEDIKPNVMEPLSLQLLNDYNGGYDFQSCLASLGNDENADVDSNSQTTPSSNVVVEDALEYYSKALSFRAFEDMVEASPPAKKMRLFEVEDLSLSSREINDDNNSDYREDNDNGFIYDDLLIESNDLKLA